MVFAILGHHNTAGVTALAFDSFESPNLFYTLATGTSKGRTRVCTYLLCGPAIPRVLVHNKALDPEAFSIAVLFAQVFHQKAFSLRSVRQDFASQEPLHLGVVLVLANLGADLKIRPYLAVLALGATNHPRLAFDISKDVIGVWATGPVSDTRLAGALHTTGEYLVDVDVVDVGVFGVGVLVNFKSDSSIGDGFSSDPANSLLLSVSDGMDAVCI